MHPGNELCLLASAIRRDHPSLSVERCWEIARQRRPDLVELDHLGISERMTAQLAPPAQANTNDPGYLLLAEISRHIKNGLPEALARQVVAEELPEVFIAWHRGQKLAG